MALNNLTLRIAYPKWGYNLPVLILMHGWDSQTIDAPILERISQQGFFCAAVGMRGRGGADGARDGSGREIYDIYDAVQKIKADYPTRVSDNIAIMGWSGGGGNALASACKFPDTYTAVISNFGMSDYGYDPTYGWYQQNAYFWTPLTEAIGDISLTNRYYSRDATSAITNYSGGKIFLIHDEGDSTVKKSHSDRIVSALSAASMTNYQTLFTTSADSLRYLHTMSYNGREQRFAESVYLPQLKTMTAWTIPASGTLTIIGYIKTKRFEIWLNEGLDAVASLVYDTATDTYTLTPMTTANISVTITQENKTASGIATVGQSTQFIVT